MKNKIFIGLISASTLLGGCNKEEGLSNKDLSTTYREALTQNPTTLDPAKEFDVDTHNICLQSYEGLVAIAEDSSIKPQLAEKWEITNDGKTYVFHLRKGVKFHNGKELTAEGLTHSPSCLQRHHRCLVLSAVGKSLVGEQGQASESHAV